jgi:arylsulfatase B
MKKTFFALFICSTLITAQAQQNTILIIGDDISPGFLGLYGLSADTATTPNLRALAASGVTYSKAWAAPVCSPTRAGMLTGRYSFRHGVGSGLQAGNSSAQLDTTEMTIGKLLKNYAPTKYNTACVGKWHVNNNTPQQRNYPKAFGFDFYSGNFSGAITDYFNYPIIRNGSTDTAKIYATTQTVNDAISWMDTMNSSKPFFLWLAFNAPHTPFHLPPSSLCNTTGLSGTTTDINANPTKYYKAAIEAMDTEIGRLIQYLKSKNQFNNTNFIFIGDNGSPNQVAQIANQTKAKETLYNYGVNVPMIVSGPNVISPNRSSDALVNTQDLFATILDMSGFTNWKNSIPSGKMVDSRSFLSDIKNEKILIRNWIFSELFTLSAPTAKDGKTIRNVNYHLLKLDDGTEEFYNQTLDKEENTNLLLGTMTTTDWTHYKLLCDSIVALTGKGTCKSVPASIENSLNSQIEIFPNPAKNRIHIKSNEKNIYSEIIDIQGKIILNTTKNEINISNLKSGIYFIKINTDKLNHKTLKFIKE